MGIGMGVCMRVSSLNKSPVHSYFCACVCNESAPESAIKKHPRCVSVFVHI